MWNDKFVIGRRLYLTLLVMSWGVAIFGAYLAILTVYEFAHDRSGLESELKIQNEKVSEFEKKLPVVDLLKKQNAEPKEGPKPKFDPTQPYEVVDPSSGRSYPLDIIAAMKKSLCISALLDGDAEKTKEFCAYLYKEDLCPKVKGVLFNCGRFNYSQLIFPALLFAPLVLLVLGRQWLLWVFFEKKNVG